MERDENDPLLQANRNVSENSMKSTGQIGKELMANLRSTRSALLTQAGLLVFALSLYYCILTTPIILFTGHPFFNSLGLLALGQGILLVQPAPQSSVHKTTQGHIHGIINSVSVTLFATGSFFIFYNKSKHGADHITTWHATFGIITYASMLAVMLFGCCIYWFGERVFGSVDRAKSFYKYHRLGGYFVLVMTGLTVILATRSDYNVNVLHLNTFVVVLAVGMILTGILSQAQEHKIKFWS